MESMIPVKMINFPQVSSLLLNQTPRPSEHPHTPCKTEVVHVIKDLCLMGAHFPKKVGKPFPVVIPNLSVLPLVLVQFQSSGLHIS